MDGRPFSVGIFTTSSFHISAARNIAYGAMSSFLDQMGEKFSRKAEERSDELIAPVGRPEGQA